MPVFEGSPLIAKDTATKTTTTYCDAPSLITNASKVCLGTGILTIPYACCPESGGGYLFAVFGLFLVACWNLWVTGVLVDSANFADVFDGDEVEKDLPNSNPNPNPNPNPNNNKIFSSAPTYSKLAYITLGGAKAMHLIDVIFVSFLFGISTSYQVGIEGFVDGIFGYIPSNDELHGVPAFEDGSVDWIVPTPSNTKTDHGLGLYWTLAVLLPLCIIPPNMSFLAKFSAAGLGAIFLSFALIIVYGIEQLGNGNVKGVTFHLNDLYPNTFTNLSHFFGIATFSFGIPPLAFQLRSSLEPKLRRTEFLPSIKKSLGLVFGTYILLGVFVAMLFHNVGVKGDILKNLPPGSTTNFINVLMILVCLVSYPLCAVPATQTLESKIFGSSDGGGLRRRLLVRGPFVMLTTLVGSKVPGFVDIGEDFGGLPRHKSNQTKVIQHPKNFKQKLTTSKFVFVWLSRLPLIL